MSIFEKIFNQGEKVEEPAVVDENEAVDVIPQSIRNLLNDDMPIISAEDPVDMPKQTIEVVEEKKTATPTREFTVIDKADVNNYKDGSSMMERERIKSVRVEKTVDFEEIYRNAAIRPNNDSIEIVVNTIKKLAPYYESRSLEILQFSVRATLETTGKDLEKIKEDGNNKVTAIKKYKESLENEINKIINDNKNKIIELENKIEQYKIDIQNKKDTAREVGQQVEDKINEIVHATNFLDVGGTMTVPMMDNEEE